MHAKHLHLRCMHLAEVQRCRRGAVGAGYGGVMQPDLALVDLSGSGPWLFSKWTQDFHLQRTINNPSTPERRDLGYHHGRQIGHVEPRGDQWEAFHERTEDERMFDDQVAAIEWVIRRERG